MENIEQRLKALTSTIQKLEGELDSLKRSGYRQSRVRVYVETDGSIDAHHDDTLVDSCPSALGRLELGRDIAPRYLDSKLIALNLGPDDEKLLDILSIRIIKSTHCSISVPGPAGRQLKTVSNWR